MSELLLLGAGSARTRNFSPVTLNNLELWLKADDLPGSGTIATWTDQSGNSRDFVQSTEASKPVVSTVNGVTAAYFDGVDDYLKHESNPINVDQHAYMVMTVADDWLSGRACYSSCASTDGVYDNAYGSGFTTHGWDGGVFFVYAKGVPLAGQSYIPDNNYGDMFLVDWGWSLSATTGGLRYAIDNATESVGNSVLAPTQTHMAVGCSANANNATPSVPTYNAPQRIYVHELIIVGDGFLRPDAHDNIISYLAAKYTSLGL